MPALDADQTRDLSRFEVPLDVGRGAGHGEVARILGAQPLDQVDLLERVHRRVRPGIDRRDGNVGRPELRPDPARAQFRDVAHELRLQYGDVHRVEPAACPDGIGQVVVAVDQGDGLENAESLGAVILGRQADRRTGGQKCQEQESCFCGRHSTPVALGRRKAGAAPRCYQDYVSEPWPTPKRRSRSSSTVSPSRSRSRPTRRCSKCCARTWGSRAPSTAASWGNAAPAPCSWTARRCCLVWCSASPARATGSKPSKAWPRAGRSIPSRRRSRSSARHSAATVPPRSSSPLKRCSPPTRVLHETTSSRHCPATSAAAPATSRSTKPSSWRPLGCGARTRSPHRRPCLASSKKATGFRVVGKAHRKVDATAKVTGVTRFADDLFLPRMLFAKLLRSPHPHARIISIDTSKAAALPGVKAVLVGKDLPIPFGILPVSQDEHALALDKVRFVGDPVAAVAATSEEAATEALDLIAVEYEVLRAFPDALDAVEHPEPAIHDYADAGNIHKLIHLEFGDVDRGLAEADLVREDLFFFEGSTHLPMEQHAAVADWSADGKLTLWSATQTPHYVHRALAKVLELPAARIRVIATPNGGGFGGKSDPFSHEIAVAKLAMITGRPVKITLTREEVFYCHRGRHPTLMWVRTGVKHDGSITGMHFKSLLDGGAYGSYGVASTYYTGALQTVTYNVPRYHFQGARAFTNKAPCGPKRGHGTPQPRLALEVHLDKIAEQLKIDPAELRLNTLA